jgi:hypothetical protein
VPTWGVDGSEVISIFLFVCHCMIDCMVKKESGDTMLTESESEKPQSMFPRLLPACSNSGNQNQNHPIVFLIITKYYSINRATILLHIQYSIFNLGP